VFVLDEGLQFWKKETRGWCGCRSGRAKALGPGCIGAPGKTMKKWIFRIIQPSDGCRPGYVFDWTILTLILASVLSVFAETFVSSDSALAVFDCIELVTSIVFSVEYALRLWTADLLHPSLSPWRARLRYVFSGLAIVDLVAILPFWVPVLFPGHLLGLRAIRLVRILRILKLNRYMEAIAVIGEVFRRKARELAASCIFIFFLMLFSSLLMYHAEHDVQPDKFTNAFAGLWWAVATLTTVGYGDIYPVTAFGRFLGAVTALLGVGLVAIPTGILSAGFVEHFSRSSKPPAPPRRCPHCGKELPRD
jgi:voltage-gated potassium channel